MERLRSSYPGIEIWEGLVGPRELTQEELNEITQ